LASARGWPSEKTAVFALEAQYQRHACARIGHFFLKGAIGQDGRPEAFVERGDKLGFDEFESLGHTDVLLSE
jgi:hypothetical protein